MNSGAPGGVPSSSRSARVFASESPLPRAGTPVTSRGVSQPERRLA
jgi:hypothetical protein